MRQDAVRRQADEVRMAVNIHAEERERPGNRRRRGRRRRSKRRDHRLRPEIRPARDRHGRRVRHRNEIQKLVNKAGQDGR